MLERDEPVNLLVMRPSTASGRDAPHSRHDFPISDHPVDLLADIDAIPPPYFAVS
jgi:hypothetical protein